MTAGDGTSKRTSNADPFTVTTIDGWLVGPTRRPTNNSSHEAGTIHDDRTARELGFRSGTIAGSIHMEQFVPLCEYAFGRDWSRSGSLSLYFLNPSIDDEPVEALIGSSETVVNGCRRRDAVMKSAAGMTILEGSASVSTFDTASAVRERLCQRRAVSTAGPRILANVPESFSATGLPTSVPQADIDARLSIITERRPEFTDATIFGHTVAPLSAAIHAMRVFEDQLPQIGGGFIGMFGAIDWQYLSGPVFADYPYEVDGRVVAIGDSPKTEMLWYECTLRDPSTSLEIARMLMLSRLLKATSPLWHEGSAV